MAEFPALPVFTDAYLADTRHLTTEEHGVYLLLLMCAWRTRGCTLKDDDRMLARIAGLTPNKWRRVRPLMTDFFSVEDGLWRQKKLSQVYEAVSKKVERNRVNGAKGGRAKSQRQKQCVSTYKPLKTIGSGVAVDNISPERGHMEANPETDKNASGGGQASKTKPITKESSGVAAGAEGGPRIDASMLSAIATAAALVVSRVDHAVVGYWLASGADLTVDILPSIERLRSREEKKAGQAPFHIGYYSSAILEARDKRLGARLEGEVYAASHPAKPKLKVFDPENLDHWRQFLGDRTSRFRGVYLSSHWCIPVGHPVFQPTGLGADPCHRANPYIPAEIYAEYGAAWCWRPAGKDAVQAANSLNSITQTQEI